MGAPGITFRDRRRTRSSLPHHNKQQSFGLQSDGLFLLRRNAGHHRFIGGSDHHILHYVVTAACVLQVCFAVFVKAHLPFGFAASRV